ncbi:molybdenum cofactor biosynthesis protein MoaE [Nocardioides sp. CN2-186]|uniref:molybdenum cofactor biosynthesis protein MoaE n=1 Tax=Nocardioides tweenelious TaxID=3156607 RepID=UPI0032B5556E
MTDPTVRLVGVREEPLDVMEVIASLEEAASGGLVLFVGRVRNHDAGKGVEGLDYSAHPGAVKQLDEVCRAVAEKHDLSGVAAIHRVGKLAVGDLAVVVATASAHRGEAFAATRMLIDTLKAEVPIWKHQRFDDGAEEWVGSA